MKESTLHILESLFLPECRDRIPLILREVELLLSPNTKNRGQHEDACLDLFEAQLVDAERMIKERYPDLDMSLEIRELLDLLSSNKRGLVNRVKVFRIRSGQDEQ